MFIFFLSHRHPRRNNLSRPRTMRKKPPLADDPWKVENPFGPPPRTSSFPSSGMRRIRNTLSKLTPTPSAEREALKKISHGKLPLTQRNVNNFVLDQQLRDANYHSPRSTELQVSAWLDKLS